MKTEKQQSEVKSKLDRGFQMDHLATKFFAENSLGQNKLSSKYYFHRKFFRLKGFLTKNFVAVHLQCERVSSFPDGEELSNNSLFFHFQIVVLGIGVFSLQLNELGNRAERCHRHFYFFNHNTKNAINQQPNRLGSSKPVWFFCLQFQNGCGTFILMIS